MKPKLRGGIQPLLFLYLITPNISANPLFVQLKDNNTLSSDTRAIYNSILSQSNVIWGGIATLDSDELLFLDTIQMTLDNENIEVYSVYRNIEQNYQYIHYSNAYQNVNVYLSILDHNVDATIYAPSGAYSVFSISDNDVFIAKYADVDIEEEPSEMNLFESNASDEMFSEKNTVSSIVPAETPVIRILFLYTSSALSLMPSQFQVEKKMCQVAYNYINKANESFSNSNVNAHLQLAYIGETSYNEDLHSWSNTLDYFYKKGDGYLDEVHSLRNNYAADICVLFLNKEDYCGEVVEINSSDKTAFCLVYPHWGCNRKFTAVHEIGHLIGCRHNRSQDSSKKPYKYGHGYYHYEAGNPSASWRTMMSYADNCNDSELNCDRIPYWSNPDIYYNGIATGTTTYENNARVWNERANYVSTFRTKDTNISLRSAYNNPSALYENYEASNLITISSGYEVQSGQIVDINAGNQIRLLPNTHIKAGSKFRAAICNNADAAQYPQFVKAKNESAESQISGAQDITLTPNPVHDMLTINTPREVEEIIIYNISGQCVLIGSQSQVNVSTLSAGIYLLRAFTSTGEVLFSKFIKQ